MLHPEHKNTLIVLSVPLTLWLLYAQSLPKTTTDYKDPPAHTAQNKTNHAGQKKSEYLPGEIDVEIRGAVRFPGVYTMRAGSRFLDLLQKAGGFTPDKDHTQTHKNYALKDGQSYFIRFKAPPPPQYPHQRPAHHRNPFTPAEQHTK